MKKVYFPQEDIVDVTVYDSASPAYVAKHIGFAYKRSGAQVPRIYALVKDNTGSEKEVALYHLYSPWKVKSGMQRRKNQPGKPL